jgi:dihydroxyacetone kinase
VQPRNIIAKEKRRKQRKKKKKKEENQKRETSCENRNLRGEKPNTPALPGDGLSGDGLGHKSVGFSAEKEFSMSEVTARKRTPRGHCPSFFSNWLKKKTLN